MLYFIHLIKAMLFLFLEIHQCDGLGIKNLHVGRLFSTESCLILHNDKIAPADSSSSVSTAVSDNKKGTGFYCIYWFSYD